MCVYKIWHHIYKYVVYNKSAEIGDTGTYTFSYGWAKCGGAWDTPYWIRYPVKDPVYKGTWDCARNRIIITQTAVLDKCFPSPPGPQFSRIVWY